MSAIVCAVLGVELRRLLRDRRALFAAVILPALLYPLIFWTTDRVERSGKEILAAREVSLALDLSAAPPELAQAARDALAQQTPIQLFDLDAEALIAFEENGTEGLDREATTAGRRALYDRLVGGSGQALVTASPDPGFPQRTLLRIYSDVKEDVSREAGTRARHALEELDQRLTRTRRKALLGADPAAGLDPQVIDIASAADSSGAALGRLLPLLAVLVLLSGGSYAALATFAGEREAGTLETLLVQPIPARPIALGKFAAVLVAGCVTLGVNLASLMLCGLAGLGHLPGFTDGARGPGLARLALGLVYLPGAVLICALLCLVCGKARSFREGQQTILPVMILTALPTAIVLQPGVETSLLLAAVPFTGAALCLRDALSGELGWTAALVMWASHLGGATLLLGRLGHLLDGERVFAGGGASSRARGERPSEAHALRWGIGGVLAMYLVGTRLQQWDLSRGLMLTLWVLIPSLALATAWRARGRGSLGRELGLTPPRAVHLLGALLCVPAVTWAMTHLLAWQLEVLPMPSAAADASGLGAIEGWSTPMLLFAVAISPGICEELFLRGALLSSLRRDLSATRAVLWQALFFALLHLSIYRLVPTFLLGGALGALRLRTASILPAMAAHALYNALAVLTQGESPRVGWARAEWMHYLPFLAPLGLLLLALPPRRRLSGGQVEEHRP